LISGKSEIIGIEDSEVYIVSSKRARSSRC
jgi:hypothetical protein